MKKTILSLLLLFTFFFARSQDTIVKKSGDKIIAKVLEIGPSEIKYKRFDFQDGPTYIETKSNLEKITYSNGVKEVFTPTSSSQTNQVIINNNEPNRDYYNHQNYTSNKIDRWGAQYRYHNERLTERDLHDILLQTKDKKIVNLVSQAKDAKSMQLIGFAAIPLGIASYFFFLKSTGLFYNSYTNRNANRYGFTNKDLTFGGLFLAGAITCPIISGIHKSKRNAYNHDAVKLYNEKY